MSDNQKFLSELLNLKCKDTDKLIKVGELVAVYNWGIRTTDNVIGYGEFRWDDINKRFTLESDVGINTHLGVKKFIVMQGYQSIYHRKLRKLNKVEIKQLKTYQSELKKS